MGHPGVCIKSFTYRDYMFSRISNNISKFADDTTIERQKCSEQEAMVLQEELSRMREWTVIWQMDFNINRCSTIHVHKIDIPKME